METPAVIDNECQRLDALKSYSILDTLPEKEYDEITYLASKICGTPISLISLVDEDRQWFKSNYGLETTETPREYAFFAHAILNKKNTLTVENAREDYRFYDNPLVTAAPNFAFYAGVPLVTPEGHALGTLCVLDYEPKVLTKDQEYSLRILSNQLMKLLELRRSTVLLHENIELLKVKNKALDKFVSVAAHDIKSPMNNIVALTDMFMEDHGDNLNEDAIEIIEHIRTSTSHSTHLVDGILNYSKRAKGISGGKKTIHLKSLIETVGELLITDDHIHLDIDVPEYLTYYGNKTALTQIFINLISNCIKYNDKDQVQIKVSIANRKNSLRVNIVDNGPGIKARDRKKIFKLFATTTNRCKDGFHGTGIGLATVKSLVQHFGGRIIVVSDEGEGANFKFTLKKFARDSKVKHLSA